MRDTNNKRSWINFKIGEVLSVGDIYSLIMLVFLTFLLFYYYQSFKNVTDYIFLNTLILFWIISISTINEKFRAGRIFVLFQRLSIVPIIFYIYMLSLELLPYINPNDIDKILIDIDLFLFRVNPTQWIYQFSNPILTEMLQVAYWLFFLLLFINGIELHITKRDQQFNRFAAIIMFSFYLTYILYMIFPAIGPRFTLHDFSLLSSELPGLFLTEFLREQINAGAGIVGNVSDPAAIVNRDCMPSGHTALTIINIYLAFQFRTRMRYMILIIGICIIISTIYLRYHYVVDILAGILTAILILIIEPKLNRWLSRIKMKI
jgi:membrane-associated phospholipid phosphatase